MSTQSSYLKHAIAVGVTVLCSQTGKVGLVVVPEVKVIKLGVAHQHSLIFFGNSLEWVLSFGQENSSMEMIIMNVYLYLLSIS